LTSDSLGVSMSKNTCWKPWTRKNHIGSIQCFCAKDGQTQPVSRRVRSSTGIFQKQLGHSLTDTDQRPGEDSSAAAVENRDNQSHFKFSAPSLMT